jgi:hypothetical protein
MKSTFLERALCRSHHIENLSRQSRALIQQDDLQKTLFNLWIIKERGVANDVEGATSNKATRGIGMPKTLFLQQTNSTLPLLVASLLPRKPYVDLIVRFRSFCP